MNVETKYVHGIIRMHRLTVYLIILVAVSALPLVSPTCASNRGKAESGPSRWFLQHGSNEANAPIQASVVSLRTHEKLTATMLAASRT